jgi:hypothetical protein
MFRTLSILVAVVLATPVAAPQQLARDNNSHEWMLLLRGSASDTEGWLMFARPYSGDIPVRFHCRPGSSRIGVSFRTGKSATKLSLRSKGQRVSLDATWDDGGEDASDPSLRTKTDLPMSNAVISEFRQSGEIAIGDPAYAPRTANSSEMAEIEKFFAFCEGRMS